MSNTPNIVDNSTAIQIALYGSQAYHSKTADANGNVEPDLRRGSHDVLARAVIKVAKYLKQTNKNVEYIPGLAKVAEFISQGYPAIDAVHTAFGSEEMRKSASALVYNIGVDIVANATLKTFTEKAAEYHKKTAKVKSRRVKRALSTLNTAKRLAR